MMEKLILELLYNDYVSKYGDELDYINVDDYYSYIGYGLESEKLLNSLGIECTTDLQDALLNPTNWIKQGEN